MIQIPSEIQLLKDRQVISDAEFEFVRFLLQLNPEESPATLLAAAACIRAQMNGHVCLDLNSEEASKIFDAESEIVFNKSEWINALEESSLVSKKGELKPLVLDDGRLYLHRLWKYEKELAQWLIKKSSVYHEISDEGEKALKSFITNKDHESADEQDIALILSFSRDLVVITGGPGTGKTFTVLKIIAAHNQVQNGKLKVAIAAPTGKASRRLTESIQAGKEDLDPNIKERVNIPDDALTVHKLLGSDFQGIHFKYNEDNKLPFDMVIVDEASMLDINLWVNLIRAISDKTKLIVLGDKDQLASVEAGSILGDICGGSNTFSSKVTNTINEFTGARSEAVEDEPELNDSVVFLKKSYRFGEESGIKILADAINNQDENLVMELLKNDTYPDVRWLDLSKENLWNAAYQYGIEHFYDLSNLSMDEMFKEMNRKKILCALRKGKYGSVELNNKIENKIRSDSSTLQNGEWYRGRMIMATKNDNILKIRNGETGFCETEANPLITFEGETRRSLSAARLTNYEPAYAITVHKSQGSEFDEVAIILPEKHNQVLSKEILYTSVTRARLSTLIVGSETIIRTTVAKSTARSSGLKKLIWN